MIKSKISVVGSGQVAAAAAMRLSEHPSLDVVLYDPAGGLTAGRLFDLASSSVLRRRSQNLTGSYDPAGTANSDVLVLTSEALADADDWLGNFSRGLLDVIAHSDEPVIVVVDDGANPLCDVAQTVSGVDCRRIIGTGTLPDSAKFTVLIARELGISVEVVDALAIGQPGRSAIPLMRFATASAIPVLDLVGIDRVNHLIKQFGHPSLAVAGVHSESVSAFGQAAAIERIVSAVGLGNVDLVPCTVWVDGEYEMSNVFLSVPAVLSPHGVDRVVELNLTIDELVPLRALGATARASREALEVRGRDRRRSVG